MYVLLVCSVVCIRFSEESCFCYGWKTSLALHTTIECMFCFDCWRNLDHNFVCPIDGRVQEPQSSKVTTGCRKRFRKPDSEEIVDGIRFRRFIVRMRRIVTRRLVEKQLIRVCTKVY